ncbi:MAG: GIY-YIG nuclease family protein [Gammaproteobacteria bacterium]
MEETKYWVYILQCSNNSYYIGYTNDLAKRYRSHVDGTGKCKYTKSFKPIKIAQCWEITGEKSFAMHIERSIKKLSRSEKEVAIANPASMLTDDRIRLVDSMLILDINQDEDCI